MAQINDKAEAENKKWKKSLFNVPKGKSEEDFIDEQTDLFKRRINKHLSERGFVLGCFMLVLLAAGVIMTLVAFVGDRGTVLKGIALAFLIAPGSVFIANIIVRTANRGALFSAAPKLETYSKCFLTDDHIKFVRDNVAAKTAWDTQIVLKERGCAMTLIRAPKACDESIKVSIIPFSEQKKGWQLKTYDVTAGQEIYSGAYQIFAPCSGKIQFIYIGSVASKNELLAVIYKDKAAAGQYQVTINAPYQMYISDFHEGHIKAEEEVFTCHHTGYGAFHAMDVNGYYEYNGKRREHTLSCYATVKIAATSDCEVRRLSIEGYWYGKDKPLMTVLANKKFHARDVFKITSISILAGGISGLDCQATVKNHVAVGAHVKKGDVIMSFDTFNKKDDRYDKGEFILKAPLDGTIASIKKDGIIMDIKLTDETLLYEMLPDNTDWTDDQLPKEK